MRTSNYSVNACDFHSYSQKQEVDIKLYIILRSWNIRPNMSAFHFYNAGQLGTSIVFISIYWIILYRIHGNNMRMYFTFGRYTTMLNW